MFIAYCVLAVLYAGMLIFSGSTKLRLDPQAVQMIHEVIGVPLQFFPVLAMLEFAGALGLLAGIRWASLGLAAAAGVVAYFVGAILSHVLVGDFGGIGGAAFMLVIASALFAMRYRTRGRGIRGVRSDSTARGGHLP